MAMLAGPRRKQKVINLRAKNSEWSNDTNKFGQRMLEKMGWSSGKGLGAKENGMVEHVVARYKNDEKGLGFEDKNDQWTKHEDDFNALLANLSNGDNNEDKLHSGVSLEIKSKTSKARVHYHKFTRGKDLTRYSEKDLANIFGKKSLKNEEKVEELLNEDIQSTEQVFTEKGSMEDYFKNKLAALNSKNKITASYNDTIKKDYEADYSFQGFSGTNKDAELQQQDDIEFQGFSFCNSNSSEKNEETDEILVNIETKKNKKNKKSKKHAAEWVNHETKSQQNKDGLEDFEHLSDEVTVNVLEPVKKRKKSKKHKQEPETNSVNVEQNKKSKIVVSPPSDEVANEDYKVPKKKKKRKNKDSEQ